MFFIIVVESLIVVDVSVFGSCRSPGGSDDRITRGASTTFYLFIIQRIIITFNHLLILIMNAIIISKIVFAHATYP